jgi:hypothetical protein
MQIFFEKVLDKLSGSCNINSYTTHPKAVEPGKLGSCFFIGTFSRSRLHRGSHRLLFYCPRRIAAHEKAATPGEWPLTDRIDDPSLRDSPYCHPPPSEL